MGRPRPAPPPVAATSPGKSPGKPVPPPAPPPRASAGAARDLRQRQAAAAWEQALVQSLIVAFVFVAIAIGAVQVRSSRQRDRSRDAMVATFGEVFAQQTSYRMANGRFATWLELQQGGVRLTPDQRVIGSNATSSHWFLSLRDLGTGVICSRTGELFDESPLDRPANCTGGP